jgi:hypothetical protein
MECWRLKARPAKRVSDRFSVYLLFATILRQNVLSMSANRNPWDLLTFLLFLLERDFPCRACRCAFEDFQGSVVRRPKGHRQKIHPAERELRVLLASNVAETLGMLAVTLVPFRLSLMAPLFYSMNWSVKDVDKLLANSSARYCSAGVRSNWSSRKNFRAWPCFSSPIKSGSKARGLGSGRSELFHRCCWSTMT